MRGATLSTLYAVVLYLSADSAEEATDRGVDGGRSNAARGEHRAFDGRRRPIRQ